MVKGNGVGLCLLEQTADMGGIADEGTVGRTCYALLSEVGLNCPWKPESGVEEFEKDCKKEEKKKKIHLEMEKAVEVEK